MTENTGAITSSSRIDQWQISLFGGLEIKKNGHIVQLPPYRTNSLLAFLLLQDKQPISRERLGGILYRDLPGNKIPGRISDYIWLINKHLPGFPLISTAKKIHLKKQTIWLDVRVFQEEASKPGTVSAENFLNLYKGELLPELYDEWVMVERERWRSFYLRALRNLTDNMVAEKKFERAISIAERILMEEPYDESVVRMLMDIYAQVGRRGAALATYEKFNMLSINEFELEPDVETKKLYETIYQQKTTPRQTPRIQGDIQLDPENILKHARTTLQEGERQLFRELIDKLPEALTAQQALERDCLKFDEKFSWGEFEQAEKIIQEGKLSSIALQLREARLAVVAQEHQKAQELLENVLDDAHRTKQPLLEAEALIELSLTKAELGESQDSLLVLDRAIFLSEKVGAPAVQVQAYIHKGVFRSLKGTGQDGKEILLKAVNLARQYRLRPLLCRALDALGVNANYYGEFQCALDYLNESLEIARDLGMGALEAKTLLTLSSTFDFLGRYKETTEAIKNAIKYYEDKQDLFGQAKCYYNLCYSVSNVSEKNLEEAIKYARQALEIFSEYENLGWQASTHTAMGYLQWLAGLEDQAIKNFDSAITLHAQLEEYRFIPENYAYKGLAYVSKNLPQKALEFTQMAVRDITRRNLSDIASEIYYSHACALQALGKENEAKLYIEMGYELLVDVAGKIEDDYARSAYFQRDPLSRRLMQMAYDFDLAPRPKSALVSRELPGSRQRHNNYSLTIDAGPADQALQAAKGNTALRRARLQRIIKEGNVHGNRLSVEEIAQLFQVSVRTVQRDMKFLANH